MVLMPSTQAQITLTAPTSNNFVKIDSFTDVTNFADYDTCGTAKTNGRWDFTMATYPTDAFTYSRYAASSSTFTDASYAHRSHYTFAGNLQYNVSSYDKITAQGMVGIGEEVISDEVLSLQTVTGNANDQLVFPKQTVQFSEDDI